MKNIIAIQHPQSEQHVNRMIGSWYNWDLTENGVVQAHNIGKRLAAEICDDKYVMYSSDLLRTKHAAEIISSYFMNVAPIYDGRIREFNLGEAVGQSKEWAKKNLCCSAWSNTIDWANTADNQVFIGAETRRDVWLRVAEFCNMMIESSSDNIT